MGPNNTEFIQGLTLSYPLGTLPSLFKTLGTVSKRGFFEKMAELDRPGGGGMPLDKIIEIIRVGLVAEKPAITIEEATELVSKYNEEYGYDALENLVIDAFADAKLTDKNEIEKRRQLVLEIRDLNMKKLEYEVHSKQADLEDVENRLKLKVADMGEVTKTLLKKKAKT